MAVNLDMHHLQHEASNYQNVERAKKNSPLPATDTQYRGAFRLAGVCIGIMCIVQATLNIVLRLYFTSQVDILAMSSDNLTLSIDELQSRLSSITADINEPGWFYFSSSIYYMSTEQKSWHQGRRDCKKSGADLVIINTKEEQDFTEMLRRGKSAWIGLHDPAILGKWKWVDGTPLKTGYWWTGEPNNLDGNEECVETGYKPVDGRPATDTRNTWNDNTCNATLFWICEKKINI